MTGVEAVGAIVTYQPHLVGRQLLSIGWRSDTFDTQSIVNRRPENDDFVRASRSPTENRFGDPWKIQTISQPIAGSADRRIATWETLIDR